jgi:single-strand DNA-binding protein
MPGLNRVQIIGHLGADPQEKVTPKGTKFAIFSVAVNSYWKGGDGNTNKRTDWFNVEAWGKTGEICLNILKKGSLVYLEGQLRTDRYEKEGETKFFTKVVIQRIQKLDYTEKEKEDPEISEIAESIHEDE